MKKHWYIILKALVELNWHSFYCLLRYSRYLLTLVSLEQTIVVFIFFFFTFSDKLTKLHFAYSFQYQNYLYYAYIYYIMIKQHILPNILWSLVKVSLSLFLVSKYILSLVLFPNVKRTLCFLPRNLSIKYEIFLSTSCSTIV